MKNKANYQDFLKIIALITMIIDHFGLYIFPEYEIMRVIGRISMPLFCFFAGYNFHDKPKLQILLVGSGLYIFSLILFKQFIVANILITIFLGQYYLYFFGAGLKKSFYQGFYQVIFLGFLWFYSWFLIDYGTVAIAIMLLGYMAKHHQANLKLTIIISVVITVSHSISTFHFSAIYVFILVIIGLLLYILMIARSFEQRIRINLRIITHNMVYIYAAHVSILQVIFLNFILR